MTVLATVVVSGALLAATASIAASDYFLKIEGVEGESTARPKGESIELQSWSFGPGQAESASPRDAAPVTAAEARLETAEVRTVIFSVPEPGDASSTELARMCTNGRHIRSALLSSPSGRYQLKDAVVSSCAVTGNQRNYELKGHVTLMQ